MMSRQMYYHAKSIAETQLHNCTMVRERMDASDEVIARILRLVQESGFIDGIDDFIGNLNRGFGLHLPLSDLVLTTPEQGIQHPLSWTSFH